MKVIELSVRNLMNVSAIDIRPDPDIAMVEIAGKNGAGKSTVIDAIWWAIGGKKGLPEQPIKDGESLGSVRIDLGDLVVTRIFTAKGSTLKVENADKSRPASPQALLERLVDGRSIDVGSFLQAPAVDQLARLKAVAGIDTTALDDEYASLYPKRTDAGREARSCFARLNACVVPEGAPEEEVSIAGLIDELNVVTEYAESINDAIVRRERDYAAICAAKKKISELESLIVDKERSMARDHEMAKKTPPDTDAVKARLAGAETANRAARARAERGKLAEAHAAAKAEEIAVHEQMSKILRKKQEALESASYPIPGLGVGDGCVTFQGRPLAQASSAEQLCVATAAAMAAAPNLRVLKISDASLLDDDSMGMIASIAEEKGYQVWVERVAKESQSGFTIRDGALVEP